MHTHEDKTNEQKIHKHTIQLLQYKLKASLIKRVHGPCCIKNGLQTLACVKLTRFLSYYLSNITMPFCLSFLPMKLTVSLNIYVPHNRLLFHFLYVILLGVPLYDVHVK